MHVLVILSAFLAATHAAPQFVFVLPQGFQQLLQDGKMPNITPFNLDQLPATAEPSPKEEMVAESVPASESATAEATPVEVVNSVPEVVAVPENDQTPVTDTIAEVTPVESVKQSEAAVVTDPSLPNENVVDIPAAETAPVVDSGLSTATGIEPVAVVEAAPVSDTEVAAEPLSAAAESVPVLASPVPSKIIPAPAVNQVDPLTHVDARFRPFIYVNDAPDVVAAKVALFRAHASRIPTVKAPNAL